MIVKDEAKGLTTAVDSAMDNCAEAIIGVDKASKDETLKIAKTLTPNVFEFEWPGSFAQARNWIGSCVKTNWILWLDGHEYFEQDIDFSEVFDPDADGYLMRVRLENGMTMLQPRILRRDIQYQGDIHNEPKLKNPKLIKSGLIVHDREHLQAPEAVRARTEQRREMIYRIMGKALKKNKRDTRAAFHLAMFEHSNLNYKKAAKYYDQFLKYSQDPKEKFIAYIYSALCYIKREKYKDAEKRIKNAMGECGEMWELSLIMGTIKSMQNKPREALGHLVDSFGINTQTQRYFPFKREPAKTWDMIANEYFKISEFYTAAQSWQRAAELEKDEIIKKLYDDRCALMLKIATDPEIKKRGRATI